MPFALTNGTADSCALSGYPEVMLYDVAGNLLGFHTTQGHSQYITSAAPRQVTLAPGASVYVLVAKYRCDLGVLSDAATIRLTIPLVAPVVLTGPASGRPSGVATLSYCRGGPDDPGQTVAVSPIEPTVRDTMLH